MSMFVEKMICSKCGKEYDPHENPLMCNDLGRFDIYYDYEAVKEAFTKEALRNRGNDTWRWKELMPVDEKYATKLGEGGTPLIKAERLAEELGLNELYLKDETRNPTASFKDRAMAVGVAKAVEMKVKVAATASSGNAAAALAAYSAKAGITTVAFVLESASEGKIAQLLLYGAKVVKVRGLESGRDPTVKMLLEAVKRRGWYPCPSFGPFNPYQVEGPKAISFEVAEQLNWQPFDWVFIPTGSGCLATGIWKGFRDLREIGFIDHYPKLVVVQPEGNNPLVRAIIQDKKFSEITPQINPRTIASGLSDPFPWDGNGAMEGVKKTGGFGISVSDESILKAMKLLAKYEGLFAEPSGVAGLAALMKAIEEGLVERSDRVVVPITGSGLKDIEVVKEMAGDVPVIEPDPEELERF